MHYFHIVFSFVHVTVHWYRNAFAHVPNTKVREVALMLKAIYASESREAALK